MLVIAGAFERAFAEHVYAGGVDLIEAQVDISERGQVVGRGEDLCGAVIERAVVEIECLKGREVFAFDDGEEAFVSDGCADQGEPKQGA